MTENSLKILVCDDSMLIRKKLKEVLKNCGYNDVLEAANGQEAIELPFGEIELLISHI